MPSVPVSIALVGVLCALGGVVSGWFAARQAERFVDTRQGDARRTNTNKSRIGICLICAVASTMFGIRFAGQTILASYLVLAPVLTALSWIDLETRRLPRQLTYPAAVVCMVLGTYAAWVDDLWPHALSAVVGGGLAFGLMWLTWLASRGQLGGGDVRMAPLLGVNLGYLSLTAVPIGLLVGFVLGAVASLIGLATRRLTRSSHIPFGPFLALGTVLTLLWHG